MNKKRKNNEKEYKNWENNSKGGRLYWKEIKAGDKSEKIARYEKEVDKDEITQKFIQKIFDKKGKLTEIHEKFPIDKGHLILTVFILVTVGILLTFLT